VTVVQDPEVDAFIKKSMEVKKYDVRECVYTQTLATPHKNQYSKSIIISCSIKENITT